MDDLFRAQRHILEQFEKEPWYDREVFKSFSLSNSISGIVGLRGVGKTSYLMKKTIEAGASSEKALFITCDHIYFLENKLLDLVEYLYKKTDVKLLCLDEIHKYPNWNQELKNISDIYRSIKVIFSGSSTIDLVRTKYDLSRRVTLYPLPGLSFREYLEFFLDIKIPLYTLNDILTRQTEILSTLSTHKILKHFDTYLKTGYYPFLKQLETDFDKFQSIRNATQKTIYEDIATNHQLKSTSLLTMEKLLQFVIHSSPGEVSINKLAKNLQKDFTSISDYLTMLKEAGLLRFLFPKKSGYALLCHPTKMYPDNANLIFSSDLALDRDAAIGKIRETFFINQLQNAGHKVYFSEIGDFLVDDMIFEIGGKNKTKSQISGHKNAYLVKDDIVTGLGKTIPLYLFGFLY